jgi:hypothetical protein
MALKEATDGGLVRLAAVLGLVALQSGTFGCVKEREMEGVLDKVSYQTPGVGSDPGERLPEYTACLQSVEQIVDGV